MELASDVLNCQRERVTALLTDLPERHACVRAFETHISSLVVADEHAWKIKKALALGFLDYSTLASRRFHRRHAVCVDLDSGDAAGALAQLRRLIQSGGHHE